MRCFTLTTSFLALSLSAYAGASLRQLLKENRLGQALSECRQVEDSPSSEKDNYLACGWVYFRSDRLESGDGMIEKLRGTGNNQPEFRLLQAYSYLKRKKYTAAREIIDSLRAEFKDTKFGLDVQEINGELYEAQGQLETAAFLYRHVIAEDAQRALAHWGLARYFLSKGENARAKTHFEKVTRLWPAHVGSRYNLAILALAQGGYAEAAKWLAECYKLDRGDTGVLEQMGVLFEKKNMLGEAVKYWQRALDLNKESTLARRKLSEYGSQLVDSLMAAGQYEAALAKLQASEKSMRGTPQFLYKRGVIYRNLGKYEKGAVDLTAFLRANPKNATAHRELGICYLNMKLLDQASREIARALENDPENGMNYAWAAFALEARGDLEKAKEVWKRAMELLTDPEELKKAARKLASIEKKLGKRKEARKDEGDSNDEDADRIFDRLQ